MAGTGGALYDALNRHRAALLRREAGAAREMTAAWRGVQSTILHRLDWLTRQLDEARKDGGTVRPSWLHESRRLESILAAVHFEVGKFARMAEASVRDGQAQAARSGAIDAQSLLRASVPRGVSWSFNAAPVESLVGFTGNGSPLRDLFDGFGAEASANVRTTLTSGVALGWNPRRIASGVADDLGVSLSRALTISRTETLRAYRAAAQANYQANSDVVGEWIWSADLSANTCGMCIAMNGTRHSLDETLDSHPNCRCAAVPVTKSWADILGPLGIDTSDIPDMSADVESGSDWFDNQSAATQRAILGPGKYAAYAAGDLDLSDLVGVSHDAEWGTSRYEKSLRQLGLSRYAGGGAA